jgi:hypothetical protein
MGGGSGLNIIFIEMLKKMDFNFKKLKACEEPFFGIVPSKAAYPLGQVSLPVTFGMEDNFRMEYLNFKSSYHAILGRPMLARFMAILHYTYLVWKMPTPNGDLCVYGDLMVSFRCYSEALNITTMNACVDCDNPHEKVLYYHLTNPLWSLSDCKVSFHNNLPGQSPANHLDNAQRIEHVH